MFFRFLNVSITYNLNKYVQIMRVRNGWIDWYWKRNYVVEEDIFDKIWLIFLFRNKFFYLDFDLDFCLFVVFCTFDMIFDFEWNERSHLKLHLSNVASPFFSQILFYFIFFKRELWLHRLKNMYIRARWHRCILMDTLILSG